MSMFDQELMLIGIKETFVIRALEKKLDEARISYFFVPPDIDIVSKEWSRAAAIAYYLDQSERLESSFLHYLNEHLTEDDKQIIIIGEKGDTEAAKNQLPFGRILKIFPRPLNVDEFISTINNQFMSLLDPPKKSILVVDDDATYVGLVRDWLRENAIRSKGICYFSYDRDLCFLFDQVGKSSTLREAGQWFATMPPEELGPFLKQHPEVCAEWDDTYGDRMQKLVFIGQHLDTNRLCNLLDQCRTE